MVRKPKRAVVRQLSELSRLRSGIVVIAQALRAAELRAARLEGYLERVQETENRPAADTVASTTDGIEKLRRVVAMAPEREAGQVLDAISPDLLDRILGKPEGEVERWPNSSF